jgi:hypothetical protein
VRPFCSTRGREKAREFLLRLTALHCVLTSLTNAELRYATSVTVRMSEEDRGALWCADSLFRHTCCKPPCKSSLVAPLLSVTLLRVARPTAITTLASKK